MAFLGYSEDFELDDDGILRDSADCKYILFYFLFTNFFQFVFVSRTKVFFFFFLRKKDTCT